MGESDSTDESCPIADGAEPGYRALEGPPRPDPTTKPTDAVTAAFRKLLCIRPEEDQGYMFGNDIVGFIQGLGSSFIPDIPGLVAIYRQMYPYFSSTRKQWLTTRDDYLIYSSHPYLAFGWQIAWTISRAPESEVRKQLAYPANSSIAALQEAISALREDVIRYLPVTIGPQFGGGSGPPEAVPAPANEIPDNWAGVREDGMTVVLSAGNAAPAPAIETGRPDGREYTVWYATNRRPIDPHNLGKGFANARGDVVHTGKCVVLLPDCRAFGSLGSPAWKRWLKGTDDRVKVKSISSFGGYHDFLQDVRRTLSERAPHFGRRDVLVYLHGYHTTFEEAAIRAGQLGADLNVPGLTAFYSWPSKGNLLGYLADEAAIEDSEADIEEFLVCLSRDTGAERVHIIAHSMGNRGLLRAIQRITSAASAKADVRFGQIFLAAPDVDVGTFRKIAVAYGGLADRTTLYVSSRDKAVWMSLLLHMFPRVGYAPPITVLRGVDTIEVSAVDFSLIGHGAYAEAEALLNDISRLISVDQAPHLRQRIRAAQTQGGEAYWQLIR